MLEAHTPKSILVVDDDLDVAESICLVLANAGFHPVRAVDGDDALARMQSERFDVVLTDLFMPDVDGTEIIEAAKKCRPEPLIVAVSGGTKLHHSTDALGRAERLGAAVLLEKPFTARELVACASTPRPDRNAA